MMLVMVIRGCTLPGAATGIEFYLKPDFSRLLDSVVWADAAVQIFYSLSCCTGGLIAMASYNEFKNNALRDSILVPLINCGTSLFAGFAIFSVLGYMAELKGVSVDEVAASGMLNSHKICTHFYRKMTFPHLVQYFRMNQWTFPHVRYNHVKCALKSY